MVHGCVHIAEQVFQELVLTGKEPDPDTGAGNNILSLDSERLLQFFQDPVRDQDGFVFMLDAVEQDRKFVPAKACDRISRASAQFEPLSKIA